jgi:2-dehydropantoate 2-reductase
MPGVSGYIDDRDVVRYWVTGVATTLIEAPDPRAAHAALEQLARRLTGADVPARIERDVASLNAATTTAFFPLIAAIDAGSGIDGLLSDKALLSTAIEAAKECDALAHRIGKVASWAHLLTKFVGPFTLKPGVALARRLSPESVRFVERHFGPKLHEQHLAMGASILALGREQGAPLPALDRLMHLLASRPGSLRGESHPK